MPLMLRFILPPTQRVPMRPVAINVDHIVSVAPRFVPNPEDANKPHSEKRYVVEGSWVETARGGEEATFAVVEEFETVMAMIPINGGSHDR